MKKNYFPSPLSYIWPLEDAINNRAAVAETMERIGFRVLTNPIKTQTIELWLSNGNTQAGAIQWGGQDAKIDSHKAVAYMLLRFYKQMMTKAVYDNLTNLGLRQDETDGSHEVRFFFARDDFKSEVAQTMLVQIQQAWLLK